MANVEDARRELARRELERRLGAVPQQAQQADQSFTDAGVTWLDNAVSGIPIIGPTIKSGSDWLGSQLIGAVTGEDPAAIRGGVQERRTVRDEQYPASALSGQIAGNLAAMGGIGSTAAGAEALGMTGAKLLPRIARSASSGALVSGADTAARGGGVFDTIESTAIGGTIGGAIPVLGSALRAGAQAIGERVYPMVNAALRPEAEAARRVGGALARDTAAAPQALLNSADDAAAQAYGVPLANVDRGGETTRALARSVANQNPEARQTIEKLASDRFGAQSQRASDFIKKITHGNVDDLGFQQAIKDTARIVNKPAYDAAFNSAGAQGMWTPRLAELMQSPAMQVAARNATSRGANRAAVDGFKAVTNPFTVGADGAFTLRVNPDGSRALPNLQFWDQTKRNLDSLIGKTGRSGDNALQADLTALKGALVSELDKAVPAYASARKGAAGYFDAEDSIEAGRKFATTPRSIPEARQAFEKFSKVEKDGFAIGYASELIDRIKASGDRTNVINSVFKSQSARESMELVFGPQKMKEIEAYVRVEDIADRLRGAMGNSTTARQLIELGLGAAGGGITTGDWTGALTGAALARGARYAGQKVDAKVMEQVANLLTKDNPAALKIAVQQAALKPAYMQALELYSNALAIPSRAVAGAGIQ